MWHQGHGFPQMSAPRVHGQPVSQTGSTRHANFTLENLGRTLRTTEPGGIRAVGPLYSLLGPPEHLMPNVYVALPVLGLLLTVLMVVASVRFLASACIAQHFVIDAAHCVWTDSTH